MNNIEEDNFWLKFLDYKNMRDKEIQLTIESLKEIIKKDEPLSSFILLNPQHENYEQYKELVGACQVYHSHTINLIKMVVDTLEAEVNSS